MLGGSPFPRNRRLRRRPGRAGTCCRVQGLPFLPNFQGRGKIGCARGEGNRIDRAVGSRGHPESLNAFTRLVGQPIRVRFYATLIGMDRQMSNARPRRVDCCEQAKKRGRSAGRPRRGKFNGLPALDRGHLRGGVRELGLSYQSSVSVPLNDAFD